MESHYVHKSHNVSVLMYHIVALLEVVWVNLHGKCDFEALLTGAI